MARKKHALPSEVFLSHSSRNRAFATELAEVLRQHGVPVWFSVTEIVGAQQWHDEIGQALARCDWFLVVLSPHALKSPLVKRELLYALSDQRYEGRIVPLVFRPCQAKKLSWTLPSFQHVDFTKGRTAGYRELLRIWCLGYTPA
jgi:hypothetical protein